MDSFLQLVESLSHISKLVIDLLQLSVLIVCDTYKFPQKVAQIQQIPLDQRKIIMKGLEHTIG